MLYSDISYRFWDTVMSKICKILFFMKLKLFMHHSAKSIYLICHLLLSSLITDYFRWQYIFALFSVFLSTLLVYHISLENWGEHVTPKVAQVSGKRPRLGLLAFKLSFRTFLLHHNCLSWKYVWNSCRNDSFCFTGNKPNRFEFPKWSPNK